MRKVKITKGIHKGKTGTVTGMFWASNTVLVEIEGKEETFSFDEVKNVEGE